MISVFFVVTLLSGAQSQYGFVRPDVMFGDRNDRFNIPDLFAKDDLQVRAREEPDYRRSLDSNNKNEELFGDDETVDDEDDGGIDKQFLANLEALSHPDLQSLVKSSVRTGGSRRSGDAEQRTLVQNAVPLDFQIEGYLPLPEE